MTMLTKVTTDWYGRHGIIGTTICIIDSLWEIGDHDQIICSPRSVVIVVSKTIICFIFQQYLCTIYSFRFRCSVLLCPMKWVVCRAALSLVTTEAISSLHCKDNTQQTSQPCIAGPIPASYLIVTLFSFRIQTRGWRTTPE
jgi:hypothetical protein